MHIKQTYIPTYTNTYAYIHTGSSQATFCSQAKEKRRAPHRHGKRKNRPTRKESGQKAEIQEHLAGRVTFRKIHKKAIKSRNARVPRTNKISPCEYVLQACAHTDTDS